METQDIPRQETINPSPTAPQGGWADRPEQASAMRDLLTSAQAAHDRAGRLHSSAEDFARLVYRFFRDYLKGEVSDPAIVLAEFGSVRSHLEDLLRHTSAMEQVLLHDLSFVMVIPADSDPDLEARALEAVRAAYPDVGKVKGLPLPEDPKTSSTPEK